MIHPHALYSTYIDSLDLFICNFQHKMISIYSFICSLPKCFCSLLYQLHVQHPLFHTPSQICVIHLQEDLFCIGWQNSGAQSRDRRNITLLGGMLVLKANCFCSLLISMS